MSQLQSPIVWLTGDFGHADFGPAVAWLHDNVCCEVFSSCSPLPHVSANPSAIVLFQVRPGSLTQCDVERMHRHAPLARLVVIAGPWCEGEQRSGYPARGVVRMLWHEWKQRLPAELGTSHNGPSSPVLRARTLSPVDRLLQSLARPLVERKRQRRAAILTTHYGRFAALADLCLAAGLEACLSAPGSLPADKTAIYLVDGWECLPTDQGRMATSPPTMLLLDWPRPDDLDRADQLGIAGVLGQPLFVTDFLAVIDRVLPPHVNLTVAHPAA